MSTAGGRGLMSIAGGRLKAQGRFNGERFTSRVSWGQRFVLVYLAWHYGSASGSSAHIVLKGVENKNFHIFHQLFIFSTNHIFLENHIFRLFLFFRFKSTGKFRRINCATFYRWKMWLQLLNYWNPGRTRSNPGPCALRLLFNSSQVLTQADFLYNPLKITNPALCINDNFQIKWKFPDQG